MMQERSRGRPRSEAAAQKALKAAHDILMDEGFGRLTMEAVASRSGVGKPTIYRNWSNSIELAMAALMAEEPAGSTLQDLPLADALQRQIRAIVRAFATTRGRQIAMTLAAADPESEFTKAFRNQVILSSRQAGKKMVEAAPEREKVSPETLEILLDMIYGPLFYRLLVAHQPLNQEFADGVVALAMRALQLEHREES